MATPDLASLTSSAQIFSANHSLPQIRAIHKALHAEIDDKAARLRTQVGGSYRDLLGTADTIVRMRVDMEAVQGTLGRMGARCGRAVVGGKVAGLGRFVHEREAADAEMGARARARLLEACLLAAGTVLRRGDGDKGGLARGDRLVVAAKLCVLGRLLVKSAGGGAARAAERSLDALRRRLLLGVKSVLAHVGAGGRRGDDVLRALSAYSLPTNSGAQDVLRHFLRVRAEAMALATEVAQDGGPERRAAPKDALRCLGLYTQTLQDVQALVPHRLPEALLALKKDTLLADESLRRMEGLRLDVYERWCGDEIRYFTPFIRHDDLDGRQAREMLTSWAKDGGEVFLSGLEKTLEGMVEFKAIVEMRTSVLKLWIAEGGKVRGFDASVMLDRIRAVVNGHMLQVLEAKVNKLRLVGSEASAALDAWREGTTDRHLGLWDDGSFDMELAGGAAQFTQDVVARLYGRNDAVSKAVASYKSWHHVIDDVGQVVDQLKRQRWDNDVDEIEDEETIEHRQKLLAKEDPQKLHDHLNLSLVKAFGNLDAHLASLWAAHREGPNKGPIAMYFLRLLRDIRGRLPELEAVKTFGLAAVPFLHEALASTVVVAPLDELATVALARRTVIGKSLWEGVPALPTSPSPGIFRFLRDLSVSMGDAGGDLWSPVAVDGLRRHLRQRLSELWREAVGSLSNDALVGEEEKGEPDDDEADEAEAEAETKQKPDEEANDEKAKQLDQRRDLLVQWLFDISYLGLFMRSPAGPSEGDELKDLEDAVYQQTGLDSAAARERLAKTSQEYWKRTSLLFGLLS
ncbi:hypothetical protein B0T22DRAFT_19825 [Podospora appendiculata]|uniref:Conserved oligomeric Golgi complex subunit 1 n=1 Tax=Podospora appendiculata TaxID=314037 RepID=A0AAE1CFT3_9PEZI|nr:hypothetical protein B0T22DRAFT_19825 [Podospora appendiculata]